ncbi:hypothetical protein NMY22_g5877 [Coprinellus aureogranulatus]|nr:hypothetical protein NMY22_g5877 [Coprinellus aureogranulatus]
MRLSKVPSPDQGRGSTRYHELDCAWRPGRSAKAAHVDYRSSGIRKDGHCWNRRRAMPPAEDTRRQFLLLVILWLTIAPVEEAPHPHSRIPTLTAQRATRIEGEGPYSDTTRPVVFQKRLKEQLEVLLLAPLRSLRRSQHSDIPKVIIIDGLDECEADLQEGRSSTEVGSWRSREEVHKEILFALLQAIRDSSFPFRIIVVSRPEPVIADFFETTVGPHRTLHIFLGDSYQPDDDIALFLSASFAELRRRYRLPPRWPEKYVIPMLVDQASGQFIYPATIIRFLTDTGEPAKQLQRILEWRADDRKDEHSSPFAALDALYARILHMSPDPVLAVQWIHAFMFFQQGELAIPTDESTTFIRSFLESTQGEMDSIFTTRLSSTS